MGGTAVGTGLNAAPGFADVIAEKVGKVYGHEFTAKSNKFYGLSHHSNLNVVHGAMKTLADDLMKIANDVRFLRSEEHTSELQSRFELVCRYLPAKNKTE